MRLNAATVRRAGRTATTWKSENTTVKLDARQGALDLQFDLKSKGGGVTDVSALIRPPDFSALVSAMIATDRQAALREFTAAIANELAKQPEYDRAIAREARAAVVTAAHHAYLDAPAGEDEAERRTQVSVREMVGQLDQADAENDAAAGE